MDINILSAPELNRLQRIVAEAENIIICCHQNPDGDAIGSSLAWAEYLRTQGKEPTVVVPNMYPDFLQWLPNTEKILRYDKHPEEAQLLFKIADTVFCLDFNAPDRLGDDMAPCLAGTAAKCVLIDHHPEPNIRAELRVSQPQASSTAELIFRLIWQLGGFEGMGRKCAIPIYTGMMTDTGAFSYNSSKPEIYFIVSQLLTKRFDKDRIYRNVYNNYSEQRLRLVGYVLYEKLHVMADCHAAYYALTRKDLRRFHFVKGDAEGIVNMPLQIKGMRLSISLREDTERDNTIWVSLRSVDNYACNTLAEKFFNGGGHANAAGGRLNCTIDEAEKTVANAIEYFKQTQP